MFSFALKAIRNNLQLFILLIVSIIVIYTILIIAPIIAAIEMTNKLTGGLTPDTKTLFANSIKNAIGFDSNPFIGNLIIEDYIEETRVKEIKEVAEDKKPQVSPSIKLKEGEPLKIPQPGDTTPNVWDLGKKNGVRQFVNGKVASKQFITRESNFKYMGEHPDVVMPLKVIYLAMDRFTSNWDWKNPKKDNLTLTIPQYGEVYVGAVSSYVAEIGDIVEVISNSKTHPRTYFFCADVKSYKHTTDDIGPGNRLQSIYGHGRWNNGVIEVNMLELFTTNTRDNPETLDNGKWMGSNDFNVLSIRKVGSIEGCDYGSAYNMKKEKFAEYRKRFHGVK